jgi:hypothetical protein
MRQTFCTGVSDGTQIFFPTSAADQIISKQRQVIQINREVGLSNPWDDDPLKLEQIEFSAFL